ncbi:putative LYAR-type C2HC zinc finger [Rosellinia necatrix]|uniref:Putative LYAR-type C2HC zinc finger n=1 Tax=Rosellinia necatrix TaxID=77044 RepID=A0A1S7UJV8_ROSNE|nr:putative LYAR-type C2HC zinc finger [Rosellinia necatrix]
MAHRAYVEDATEEYEGYQQYQVGESEVNGASAYNGMPPPAVGDGVDLNVFDYQVLDMTPNVSKVNYQPQQTPMGFEGGRQLVRFDRDENNYVDETGYMIDDGAMGQYGPAYETPAPKVYKKKTKDVERELKKDKKRKRLHIETSPALLEPRNDEVMTDAPPVLHSGLTGGLNRMMRPSQFPPSPDYSGGDAGEPSPANSIKKKKPSKSSRPRRADSFGSNLKALVSGTSKSKVSKTRKHSSERKEKKRRTHHRSTPEKSPKLIEYRAKSADEKGDESGTLVVYRPRSDLFLSLCTKGPESERGCSVNKALKRFHRERTSSGTSLGKGVEEKELWRSLRMRRNERGEIVLFSLEEEEAV